MSARVRGHQVLGLGLVLLATATGTAAPRARVPAGWTLDEPTSAQTTTATELHYRSAGRRARVEVAGYQAPGGPASLYLTLVHEELAADQPAAPDAAGLDERRGAIASEKLAELTRAAADNQGQVEASAQRWVADGKFVEGTIRWTARDTGLRVVARTVVAANAAQVASITGECYLGVGATAALETACLAALDTLTLDLAVGDRLPLAISAAPATIAPATIAPAVAPATTPAGAAPSPPAPAPGPGTAPRLDEGPPGTLVRMSPARREPDRRPVYIGGGIVLMAAVFWWNRRRRERFERDDDADDLAAAARGDEKDKP